MSSSMVCTIISSAKPCTGMVENGWKSPDSKRTDHHKLYYIYPRECDGIYIYRNKQESCVITLAVMKIVVEFTATLQSSTCINHI